MYIDSHAHIFSEDFHHDLEDVLKRAQDSGVDSIVVPGTTRETSEEAIELAERYPFVYACVGYHPHAASEASAQELSKIEDLCNHRKVVAVGEIGLDFHYDLSPREKQVEVFEAQVMVAVRKSLPVVVHTRESLPETTAMVERISQEYAGWCGNGSPRRGVFHCFTGDAEQARRLFTLGFYVSYPGIVTFKNSPVTATLKTIGSENILLETDSPYLAPVPYRGRRNEPANIPVIATKIAEILETTPSVIASRTTNNARNLFRLETH